MVVLLVAPFSHHETEASNLVLARHVDRLSQVDPAKAFHHSIQDLHGCDLACEVCRYLDRILYYKAQARCGLTFYLAKNPLACQPEHGQGIVDPLHGPEVHGRQVFQPHDVHPLWMAVAQADSADYAADDH